MNKPDTPGAVGKKEELTRALRLAGPAHHRAYLDTNGEDPEWPLWYAGYLHPQVTAILSLPLTRSELVCWLVLADKQHRRENPEADWPSYYAELFLQFAEER
jgi:hypothetical protein